MIRETLTRIANEYNSAKQEEFSGHGLARFIRNEARDVFQNCIDLETTNFIIKSSAGQSNWSDVPWIAFQLNHRNNFTWLLRCISFFSRWSEYISLHGPRRNRC
ncbi:MAG: DUF3578 domain-containing protein [Alphaproteobacteria bacterium]|nr:DUF3578 domain-containing protein [Alphaproteobacteria bacterium]